METLLGLNHNIIVYGIVICTIIICARRARTAHQEEHHAGQ